MSRQELTLIALCVLIGVEGEDYSLYEFDETWWDSRLWMSRN